MKRRAAGRSAEWAIAALLAGVACVVPCVAAGGQQAADLAGRPAGTGPADASVSIVEYTDFACGTCARLQFMLKALADTYPKDVQVLVKQDPASENPDTWGAHEAALAAGAQGGFWEMADMLFANPRRRTRDDFIAMAGQLHLDATQFAADLDSGRFRSVVESDRRDAVSRKLGALPVYFVNGERQPWPSTFADLKAKVSAILATKGR